MFLRSASASRRLAARAGRPAAVHQFKTGRYAFIGRLRMYKALVSTFLVLVFFICAVTELRASPDIGRDEPFDMAKLDMAKFVAPKSPTWREWRKIKANV